MAPLSGLLALTPTKSFYKAYAVALSTASSI